jgi:hypothetical protein
LLDDARSQGVECGNPGRSVVPHFAQAPAVASIKEVPMRTVILAVLAVLLPTTVWADLMLGPQVFIEDAAKAHGGETAINKYRAEIVKMKGTIHKNGKDVPFTGEYIVQLPQQLKQVLRYEEGGKPVEEVRTCAGDQGWVRINDRVRDYTRAEVAEDAATLHAYRMARLAGLTEDRAIELKNLNVGLSPTPLDKKRAWGIRVVVKGQRDVDLFIDAESKLLLKIDRMVPTADGKAIQREEYLDDYKAVMGVQRPRKRAVHLDGRKVMDAVVIDIKLSEQVPEKVFARP